GGGAVLPSGSLFLAGSDDPALELLPDALHGENGAPVLFTATLGSVGGLQALAARRADVACAHLVDRTSGEYNLPQVPRYLTGRPRSEEHTSELQSLTNLVCRLLLEKKNKITSYDVKSATSQRLGRRAAAAA